MGDLVPEIAVTKQVTLTNHTAAPITILRAIADCACTTPSWPMEPIEPGESVETDITKGGARGRCFELGTARGRVRVDEG